MERAVAKGKAALSADCARRIVAIYHASVRRGLSFHAAQPSFVRQPGARGRSPKRLDHNLLQRLRDHKAAVLRFVFNFAVPFTNNQAEQGIRTLKVKMTASGGFRSWDGVKTSQPPCGRISTARKHGWNILRPSSSRRLP